MKKLEQILETFALKHTFNNNSIIENSRYEINLENISKRLNQNQSGGLCYELNPLFYKELKELGYDVHLVRASTFDTEKNSYYKDFKTHVAIILDFKDQKYLLDSGYGANIPLKAVNLNGDLTNSRVGEFKIEKFNTIAGEYHLHLNLHHKNEGFILGYSFFMKDIIDDINKNLFEIEEIIATKSHFKDAPLYIKNISNGHITVTSNSLTIVEDLKTTKTDIQNKNFKELIEEIESTY